MLHFAHFSTTGTRRSTCDWTQRAGYPHCRSRRSRWQRRGTRPPSSGRGNTTPSERLCSAGQPFLAHPVFFLRKLEGKETPCSSGGREGSRRRRRDQHLRLCESDAALGPRRLSGLEQLLVKRRQTGKKLLPHRTDNAWTRQLMVIRREFGVYGILSHTVTYRLPSTEPYAAIQ